MENFLSLKLEETLVESLAKINFKTPTPIQAKAIPIALEGKDILGTAQTGTGKTGAFGIPLVNYLLKTKKDTALVMTPTRELATQVMQTMNNLIGRGNIRTALLIGGDSMQKQLKQMRRNPRLIVGTPGRINDHLKRQTLKLNNTTFLVLDESDRMLDMGFTPQINQVLETVPRKHQTLLFSATLPGNIIRLATKYLNQPVRISVGSTSTPIAKIKQEVLRVKDGDKYNQLIKEIYTRQGSILIFVKTRRNAEKMVKRLKYDDHDADAIHGNLRQNKRDRVIKALELCEWGLVPAWSKKLEKFSPLINARKETLMEKVTFKNLIQTSRCLVIADGYYEWKREEKNKIPYYFTKENNEFMFLAAIHQNNQFCIITREATEEINKIHHREPLILNQSQINNFLNMKKDPMEVLNSVKPPKLKFYEITKDVNNPLNNDPNLINKLN